jgi:hypothetical protein
VDPSRLFCHAAASTSLATLARGASPLPSLAAVTALDSSSHTYTSAPPRATVLTLQSNPPSGWQAAMPCHAMHIHHRLLTHSTSAPTEVSPVTRPPNRRAAGSMTSCAWQIQDQITCLLAEQACVRACRRADLDPRYRGRIVKQRPYLCYLCTLLYVKCGFLSY